MDEVFDPLVSNKTFILTMAKLNLEIVGGKWVHTI